MVDFKLKTFSTFQTEKTELAKKVEDLQPPITYFDIDCTPFEHMLQDKMLYSPPPPFFLINSDSPPATGISNLIFISPLPHLF